MEVKIIVYYKTKIQDEFIGRWRVLNVKFWQYLLNSRHKTKNKWTFKVYM